MPYQLKMRTLLCLNKVLLIPIYIFIVFLSELPTGTVSRTKYEQKYINIDGINIRYIDEGHGKTLLCVHGHQSRLEEFEGIIGSLKDSYRLVAFDLPGSGFSDQPDINYSLEYYEKFIVKFADTLNIEKPMLIGGSLGGNLILRLTRHYPEEFSKSIVWSPAGVWPSDKILGSLTRIFYDSPLYWVIFYFQSQFWFSDNFKYKEACLKDAKLYILERYSPQFRRATAQIAAQQLEDSHIGLGKYNKIPLLMMVGKNDSGFNLAKYAIQFAKELPDVKLVIFNTGHAVPAENYSGFIGEIKDFIK